VLLMVALAALCASLALAMARLDAPIVADVFAVSAAICALAAFVTVGLSTIRRARRLSSRSRRP
jgi:hypothetical protein